MSLVARIGDLATRIGNVIRDTNAAVTAIDTRVDTLEAVTYKTVNGQTVTGSGNIQTAVTFTTDSAAAAHSTANPGVTVFSSQAT